MRLLDANLSPTLVAPLTRAGHDVEHVDEVGLVPADDEAILDHAADDRRVVVTVDSDFPMLLALRRAAMPSVVLLRHVTHLSPEGLRSLLEANLPLVRDDLEAGAVVSLSPTRTAVRDLPLT